MGAKKAFAAAACAAAIALALAFGLFPFCEHKINWDAAAAKVAEKAADAGCGGIAADIAGRIKYRQFAGAANAHIALLKYRESGAQKANAFIKTCGENFDFDEYSARLMLEEIDAEPDFAPGFFKMKYLPQIEAQKNPFLKAVLLCKLSMRAKNGGLKECAARAFEILKKQPACEGKTRACVEISRMALEGGRPEIFFEAFKICPRNPHFYAAFFRFLQEDEFREYARRKNAARQSLLFYKKLKGKEHTLEAGKILAPAVLNIDCIIKAEGCIYFNAPLFAYISFLSGEKEALEFYKSCTLSAQNIRRNQRSHFGYLKASAAYFAAMEDFDAAFYALKLEKDAHKRLKILNSAALAMGAGKAGIQFAAKALLEN